MPTVPQRYRQTDGQTDRQTDGRTTYDSNTALALRASRGKNDFIGLIIKLIINNDHMSSELYAEHNISQLILGP